jgi:aspartokinase/homoserine dehydrogenase 1
VWQVTILARACGMLVSLEDVPVQSLVPSALQNWSPAPGAVVGDAFVEQMKAFDGEAAARLADADAHGNVLRFVGVVDVKAQTVSVELKQFPKSHPFAGTQWADNICAFSTQRYTPQPLVVQGPGAGAAVTAAGIYADFLKIAKSC